MLTTTYIVIWLTMKATEIVRAKFEDTTGNKKLIIDFVIWRVNDKRFANGLKFRMICVEPKTGKKVLMDNHHGKPAHVHLDDSEFLYDGDITDYKSLVKSFRSYILSHFGVKI